MLKKNFFALISSVFIVSLMAAEVNQAKIAEIKAGKLVEANASWWGFNETDATECLQQAICSGAKKLVVPNMGKPWILSKPVELASNQELILAKGTVIQAKKGAFQSVWLGLFLANKIENFTMRGEGDNVLRMNIDDYNNQKLYKVSEWRHGIFLTGCKNVKILNLTIKDTGGDGIAIGSFNYPCTNMLIENVVLDNCNRLGLGMVSGENITIRKCTFMNARHMPPSGGIDMEPNRSDECISNILIEDCIFKNNNFNAITLAVYNLNEQSKPVSVTVRNCKYVENNRMSLAIQGMKKSGNGCKGFLVMENCRVASPISFLNVTQKNFSVLIKNTELVLPKGDVNSTAAIEVMSNGNHDMEIGGIVFDNVKIISPDSARKDFALSFDGLVRCSEPVKGTLYSNGKLVDFAPTIKAGQAKLEALRKLQTPTMPNITTLVPAQVNAPAFNVYNRLPLRRKGIYLIAGTKGQKLSFKTKIWDFYKSEGYLIIKTPSGRQLDKKPLPYTQTKWTETMFMAEESGIYQIEYNPNINAVEFRTALPSAYLAEKGELIFVKPQGKLYFTVPAGTDNFSVSVASNAGTDVKIYAPSGQIKAIKKGIKAAERLSVQLAKDSKPQVWSIEINNCVWEATLRLYAPLIPILSENPKLMLQPAK